MADEHTENKKQEIRTLDITDLERIERFRRAGYGGAVSDALYSLGVRDTVFSDRFKALRPLAADRFRSGRSPFWVRPTR